MRTIIITLILLIALSGCKQKVAVKNQQTSEESESKEEIKLELNYSKDTIYRFLKVQKDFDLSNESHFFYRKNEIKSEISFLNQESDSIYKLRIKYLELHNIDSTQSKFSSFSSTQKAINNKLDKNKWNREYVKKWYNKPYYFLQNQKGEIKRPLAYMHGDTIPTIIDELQNIFPILPNKKISEGESWTLKNVGAIYVHHKTKQTYTVKKISSDEVVVNYVGKVIIPNSVFPLVEKGEYIIEKQTGILKQGNVTVTTEIGSTSTLELKRF